MVAVVSPSRPPTCEDPCTDAFDGSVVDSTALPVASGVPRAGEVDALGEQEVLELELHTTKARPSFPAPGAGDGEVPSATMVVGPWGPGEGMDAPVPIGGCSVSEGLAALEAAVAVRLGNMHGSLACPALIAFGAASPGKERMRRECRAVKTGRVIAGMLDSPHSNCCGASGSASSADDNAPPQATPGLGAEQDFR
jgi:hypothetical protein